MLNDSPSFNVAYGTFNEVLGTLGSPKIHGRIRVCLAEALRATQREVRKLTQDLELSRNHVIGLRKAASVIHQFTMNMEKLPVRRHEEMEDGD